MSAAYTPKQGRNAGPQFPLAVVGVCAALVAAAIGLGGAADRPGEPTDAEPLAGRTAPRLSLRLVPHSGTVAPGGTEVHTVRIHHRGHRSVWLRVSKGLPGDATASVQPRATRASTATLTVHTTAATPIGSYRVQLRARSGTRHAKTSAVLFVAVAPSHGFEIGGSLADPLSPGLSVPLDLTLTNPDYGEIRITDLEVSISQVVAPQADEGHPCSVDDFSVTPFSGDYPFAVGGNETSHLSELGIPEDDWPRINMFDRAVNQDGCKGASLTLEYAGVAQGGGS
jgi:hypothetical protein